MIRISEHRIGNVVWGCIKQRHIYKLKPEDFANLTLQERCDPIELTPDMLVRLGWQEIPQPSEFWSEQANRQEKWFQHRPQEQYLICWNADEGYRRYHHAEDDEYSYIGGPLFYVHDVQNYFPYWSGGKDVIFL